MEISLPLLSTICELIETQTFCYNLLYPRHQEKLVASYSLFQTLLFLDSNILLDNDMIVDIIHFCNKYIKNICQKRIRILGKYWISLLPFVFNYSQINLQGKITRASPIAVSSCCSLSGYNVFSYVTQWHIFITFIIGDWFVSRYIYKLFPNLLNG